MLAPHVRTYIAPPARNVSLIQITQNVTHYTVIQNRVVNRGIPVERIETVIARPVPRMLIGVVIIVGALTFIPALALGPIVEHLLMVGA